MSKKTKYKKQHKMVVEYHKKQQELCMQEIAHIHQLCIEIGLMHTK